MILEAATLGILLKDDCAIKTRSTGVLAESFSRNTLLVVLVLDPRIGLRLSQRSQSLCIVPLIIVVSPLILRAFGVDLGFGSSLSRLRNALIAVQ